MSKLLFEGYEWDENTIENTWEICDDIGRNDLGLDYYPPQFDIVTAEQMLDAYASIGMPIYYNHWSFGKQYAKSLQDYRKGNMGLAYEMVINSNPCLAYLMEDNTACTTALVIAHANVGHASFFKMNYLFQQHTDPSSILNFLEYTKKYIFRCEEMFGKDRVEALLDRVHTIAKFGVDKYPKKAAINDEERQRRELAKLENEQKLYDATFANLPVEDYHRDVLKKRLRESFSRIFSAEDHNSEAIVEIEDENLLRVIADHSITLRDWEREIVRIIAKIEQYFYPQGQTKIMNEGWACFCHYYIMEELYKRGSIDEGAYIEFLQLHTAVCFQPGMNHLNPYALGFAMFMDIKRACLNPDEEDYKYLKTVAGKEDWRAVMRDIIKYYKDESFILQFLGPKVIRKFKLFAFKNDSHSDYIEITGIQNDDDIHHIRNILSRQTEIDNRKPNIEVDYINRLTNVMTINYTVYKDRQLDNHDLLVSVVEELTGLGVTLIAGEDDYGL